MRRPRLVRIVLLTVLAVSLVLVPVVAADPPTVSITGGPSGTVPTSSATFTFDVTDDPVGPTTVECSLDGGTFAACSSGIGYSGLADGGHSFEVRVSNDDGSTSASRSWTVDTTGPSTSITSAPPSLTNDKNASFSFSASGAASYACRLDGGGFEGCTSPKNYNNLGDGSHTYTVHAIDAVGNTGPDASYTWTIDTAAPTTTIISGPPGTSGPDGNVFTFSASEPATFGCRLDGSTFSACSSGISYSSLASGSHTFEVRATDGAGNVGAAVSRTWTVDASPPDTTITGGPTEGSVINDPTPTFTFSATETPSTFQCSVDGAGFSACSSPTTPSLADGAHSFAVRAVDGIGNVDPTPAARSFTVDTTGPTTTITSGPSGTVGETSATFAFSASEGGVTFACQIDGGAFATCTSPRTYTGLASGGHTFSVRATDAAGNVGTTASTSWTVDATPPETSLSGAPTGTVATNAATIGFSASEPSTFECSLDGAGFASCTSPVALTDLADGAHTFSVRATDGAGNTDPSPATASWAVDTTPPVITTPGALAIEANGPAGSKVTYSVTASDGGVALLPGAVSCAPASGSLFPLGETTVTCQAADAIGNVGSESFVVTVADTTAPTLNAADATFAATSAAGISRNAPPVATYLRGFTAFDLVGVISIRSTAPEVFPVGATKITVTAADAAGNQTQKTVTVTVLPPGSTPPPPPDQKPPADVTRVRAVAGDHTVTLSWVNPAQDVALVEIRMSTAGGPQAGRVVYRGLRSPQVIKRLRNDVEHRFVLTSVDAAGNRSEGIVALATPKALLLAAPKPGARVTKAPLLRWAPVGGASYFNVQLYKGKVKVLSVWPTKARFKMKLRWVYEKKKRALTPGKYTWYVWPGLGSRAEARYGPLLGRSTFVYAKPKKKLAAKKPAKKQPAKKTGSSSKG